MSTSMVVPHADIEIVDWRITYPRFVCGADDEADRQNTPSLPTAFSRSAVVSSCGTPTYTPGTKPALRTSENQFLTHEIIPALVVGDVPSLRLFSRFRKTCAP